MVNKPLETVKITPPGGIEAIDQGLIDVNDTIHLAGQKIEAIDLSLLKASKLDFYIFGDISHG